MEASYLLIFVGPSCAGKSTFLAKLCAAYPNTFYQLLPFTTRPRRPNEVHMKDYCFVTSAQMAYLRDIFFEHNEFAGHQYGLTVESLTADMTRTPCTFMTLEAAQQKTDYRSIVKAGRQPIIIQLLPSADPAEALNTVHTRLAFRGRDEPDVDRSTDTEARLLETQKYYQHLSTQPICFRKPAITIVNDSVDRAFSELQDFLVSKQIIKRTH